MKSLLLVTVSALYCLNLNAQTTSDSTKKNGPDTIRVGNFVIVKKQKDGGNSTVTKTDDKQFTISVGKSNRRVVKEVSTNWWILDLGFANVVDRTNYAAAQSVGYFRTLPNGGPVNQNSFRLNNAKSTNVNLWFFMQRRSLYKSKVNLKYGLGLEMYNFRYSTNISFRNNPQPFVHNDSISFSKNKLYAGYLTVPVMLNFNLDPSKRRGLSASVGVSAGYLIAARNKQVSNERGKEKDRGTMHLEPWRFAAIAELGLGPVRLYGSYSFNNLHKADRTGLDQTPYVIGVRLSNW